MKNLKYFIVILLIFSIGSSYNLHSQGVSSKPTRQSSLEAFSKGDYEKAYTEFIELLKIYSKDALYKYYASVCLVKLERNPGEAESLMKQAIDVNTSARPLPADALFYLGRAQQLNGNFNDATGSYNKYADQIGKRNAREQGVPELIQQCIDGKGAIQKKEVESSLKPVLTLTPAEVVAPVIIDASSEKDGSESTLPSMEPLPEEYSKLLDEALAFQFLADSLKSLAEEQKLLLQKLPADKKQASRSKIAEYEALASTYQKSADQKYDEAHAKMNPGEHRTAAVLQDADSQNVKNIDNQSVEATAQVHLPSDSMDIYYYFKILDKPETDPSVKIEIDPRVPEGLIYRIQIAVFRNPVSPVFFKGITPVYGFRNEGSQLKTYYAGMFRRIADARNALEEIKGKGFKDSFITSFMGSKSVSADRAAVLEKEWGKKPFSTVANKVETLAPADTLPPTLVFRVEVLRVAKPAKPDIVESLKTLSGNRGLDIITLEDKKIVYLIGNFITFESAAEYADLVVRNGYRDAKVVAWLGKREIPIETAKQLFDNLK